MKPGHDSNKPGAASFRVPVGISGRHTHLSRADLNALFGSRYELTPIRNLSQPGQFVSKETIGVIGPKGIINEVRILGPTRAETVIELMRSDLYRLGYDTEVTAGERFWVKLSGPEGVITLPRGGMVSPRHLHATPEDAERHGLTDGITAAAWLGAPGRETVFLDVKVRVDPDYAFELHLDQDEGNACSVKTGDTAWIIPKGAKAPQRSKQTTGRHLLTEEDIITAYNENRIPDIENTILTPYAKEALIKYFPDIDFDI